jgi:hypothetical protein
MKYKIFRIYFNLSVLENLSSEIPLEKKAIVSNVYRTLEKTTFSS